MVAADVQTLMQQYKDQFQKASENVVAAANNAPQHIETLKQKVTDLQPTVQGWVDSIQNTLKGQILDMAPVGTEMAFHKAILEIYALVGVGLFASAVGFQIGSRFTATLVEMCFSLNYTFALAFIVIPIATIYYVRKTDMPKDDRNLTVITSAFCSGLLSGYLMNDAFFAVTPPPMFVLPLMIGVTSVFLGPSLGSQPRSTLLGACLGAAVGVFFAIGLITGSLGGSYMMWTSLLAGVGFVDYQLKLGHIYEGSYGLGSLATISIATYLATGFLLTYFMFGHSSEQSND